MVAKLDHTKYGTATIPLVCPDCGCTATEFSIGAPGGSGAVIVWMHCPKCLKDSHPYSSAAFVLEAGLPVVMELFAEPQRTDGTLSNLSQIVITKLSMMFKWKIAPVEAVVENGEKP